MILTLLLFFLATMVMTSAGVIGYWFLRQRRTLLGKQGQSGATAIEWVEPGGLLKTDSLSTISVWARLLARIDYIQVMRARMMQAGVCWSVGRLTALMLLAGALGVVLLARVAGTSNLVTLAGGIAAALVPYGYILRLRSRRLGRMEGQFSDALDSLARAMRAGNPLAAALEIVAAETPEPLAGHLRILVEERRLGGSWDEALDNLTARVPLVETNIFAAALKLQNRTGGRLSDVLGRLAETMRDSDALRSEVRSIAAHGKLTGKILTILPLVIAAIMVSMDPGYFDLVWVHPIGKDLVVAACLSLVGAHLLIRKLVDIKL
jgi:tight adherence protein B